MPNALDFTAQIKKLEAFRHGQADSTALDEFDVETEQLILRTLGQSTLLLEAYGLAIMGEAETIVNMPQPAQEDAVQDLPRKAIEQRRQVLEACMAELEAALAQPKAPQHSRAPAKKAKKAKKAMKAKPRAAKKMAAKKKRTARGKAKKPATAAKKKRAKRR
jgi:hypothetical protein